MTSGNVTCKMTKLAWIRDPKAPAGAPALGSFRCPCGNVIEGVGFADGSEHPCTCGNVYDSRGWLTS